MLATLLFLGLTATVCLGSPFGQCPNVKVVQNFDLEKFAGTWYEVESYPSFDKLSKRCSRFVIDFKEKNKAGLLHKYISAVSEKERSEYSDISATKEPAKLTITPLKGSRLAAKRPMWIVDTDYENYAIGYSCQKKMITKTEDLVIMSRQKTLDDKLKVAVYDTLKKNDISQKSLVEVDQSHKNCQST